MNELTISMPQQLEFAGPFDNILKSLIQWPDFAKVDRVMLKQGITTSLTAFKSATNAIGALLIDAMISGATGLIDGWKAVGPDGRLVLGASEGEIITLGANGEIIDYEKLEGFGSRSREEVDNMIRAEGGDPKGFAPWLLFALQFLPTAIEMIRKILGK